MQLSEVFSKAFPKRITFELSRLAVGRGVDVSHFSEIRLRAFGVSSATLLGERLILSATCSAEDLKRCFSLLCEGSPYAYRDSIKAGYITLACGVRVGICGRVRYEDGKSVGICEVDSLVFRIPTADSDLVSELLSAWSEARRGMLIYSPPGVGKTTALRTLILSIGKKKRENVVVVDEREEFIRERYLDTSVDVMRGYKHAEGASIALRVLSPDVIAIDELGGADEALSLLESANSGVKIIATAHAGSYAELLEKKNLEALISEGVFDVFFGIFSVGGLRRCSVEVLNG